MTSLETHKMSELPLIEAGELPIIAKVIEHNDQSSNRHHRLLNDPGGMRSKERHQNVNPTRASRQTYLIIPQVVGKTRTFRQEEISDTAGSLDML